MINFCILRIDMEQQDLRIFMQLSEYLKMQNTNKIYKISSFFLLTLLGKWAKKLPNAIYLKMAELSYAKSAKRSFASIIRIY